MTSSVIVSDVTTDNIKFAHQNLTGRKALDEDGIVTDIFKR